MARYPHGGIGWPRSLIYIISALLVVAVVVTFIYKPYPFGKKKASFAR